MIEPCIDAYVETNRLGRTMAHVPQLPGCIVRAVSAEVAVGNLEKAIHQYNTWLSVHRKIPFEVLPGMPFRIVAAEKGGAASGSGSRVAILPSDRLGITEAELQDHFERMGYSREDLLDIVSTLSHGDLAFHKNVRERTIRGILLHLAEAEQWYLTRLTNIPPFPRQKDPVQRLQGVREAAIYHLSRYPTGSSAQVVIQSGEPWTLRKVLRRFLEHEREHFLEIIRLLHSMGRDAYPQWMQPETIARELHLAQVAHF